MPPMAKRTNWEMRIGFLFQGIPEFYGEQDVLGGAGEITVFGEHDGLGAKHARHFTHLRQVREFEGHPLRVVQVDHGAAQVPRVA